MKLITNMTQILRNHSASKPALLLTGRHNENELILNSPERNKILHDGPSLQNLNNNLLGRGTYGIVIKAIYKSKPVAVKIIKHLNYNQRQTVRNESNILGWQHSNIIQILKIESTTKFSIVIMERSDGLCLQKILDACDIPLMQRVSIAKNVLEGLIYCHNHDLLHMDIKPQNIMVVYPSDSRCICKLCDFGSSLKISQQTVNIKGLIKGTVRYMAPEALRGEEFLNPAADIFSFGITLWQLKYRQMPYHWLLCNDAVVYQVVKHDLRPNSLNCNSSSRYNKPSLPNTDKNTIQNCGTYLQQQSDFTQHSLTNRYHILNSRGLPNTVFKTNPIKTAVTGQRAALMEINGNASVKIPPNKYESKTITKHDFKKFNSLFLKNNFQTAYTTQDISMKETSYDEIYKRCWCSRSTDRLTAIQLKQRLKAFL